MNLPTIPADLISNLDITRWLLSHEQIGWIELDIEFDVNIWQQESEKIKEYLVNHREGDGHIGWQSCCLHGRGIQLTGTDDSAPDDLYHWTSLTKLCPSITQFWKSFPTEKFKRLRFMELAPGGLVSPHSDGPSGLRNTDFDVLEHMVPINVAITHPTECSMRLISYGNVPFSPGKMFTINITDTHTVVNNSNEFRMHMIAHCVVGNKKEEFADLIVKSYRKQYEKSKA